MLSDAIAALPPKFRRRLMVSADGAGASHGLTTRLDQLASRPGHQLTYSVGWELGGHDEASTAVAGWDKINWRAQEEEEVRRLRQRIFTAAREQDWPKVRNLQKLTAPRGALSRRAIRPAQRAGAGARAIAT